MRQLHRGRGDPGRHRPRLARAARGFTLIELVVTMLIIAILAAIAIPSYSSYVRKGRRTDAKSALLDMASLEERYYSVNNVYTNSPANLGYSGTSFPTGGLTVGSGYYTVTMPTAPTAATNTTPASYSLEADPTGDQTKDTQCAKFTLTSQGVQGSNTSAGTANTEPGTCW
jgi:type IV pilus assembly protein PilE